MATTVATGMRSPRMQGCPFIFPGSTVIGSKVIVTAYARGSNSSGARPARRTVWAHPYDCVLEGCRILVDSQFGPLVFAVSSVLDFTAANPPPAKDACKRDGWESYTDDEGTPFKNQGDCVSYVATGGSNKARDHAVIDQLLLEAGAFG